jgi:regulatory protein SWI6
LEDSCLKVGDTALNIAARIGNRSIISQLLEVNADPAIANSSKLRPVDFGIGDRDEIEGRVGGFGEKERAMAKETRESSGEIIHGKFMSPLIAIALTNMKQRYQDS